MIPADLASRMQVSADTTLRPVAPTQEISDKLSGLSAGQRVMAEIQAMLPNGTYRAMINQRKFVVHQARFQKAEKMAAFSDEQLKIEPVRANVLRVVFQY